MAESLIARDLILPDRSFFLFGPRGTGKSTLLQARKFDHYFNLLQAATYLQLSQNPSLLEARVGRKPRGTWVCIDEVQKFPSLLDEVHRLIEERGWKFALSGSSARKLKRGGANLLAGRASVRNLFPFNSHELGSRFKLDRALEWGSLPAVVNDPGAGSDILAAYVDTYLKEEIREEGLVRRLEPFARFLGIAALFNGQVLNAENVARDAQTKRTTVDLWFEILEDTLLGFRLPAWRPRLKSRESAHPKFYWFDPGVARAAAGLLDQPLDSTWKGFALETVLLNEIRSWMEAQGHRFELASYRSAAGVEIDFVIQTARKTLTSPAEVICLEVKSAKKWDRAWERGLRGMMAEKAVRMRGAYGVYLGSEVYEFDGVTVLPIGEFLARLHAGELLSHRKGRGSKR